MEKHPERKGGYFCPRGTVVPHIELQKMVFTFVEDDKVKMTQLKSKGKYRSTAMVFITLLEHMIVVILQDLFLNPIFSCNLFKDYAKVMRAALDTIHET
jgi:hypothetical protein